MVTRPVAALSALVTAVCVACSSASTPTAPSQPSAAAFATAPASAAATVASIIELTNGERARAGLPPLRAEPRLTRAAQLQADQIAQTGRLDHVITSAAYPRPEDRLAAAGYPWQAYAENIASGYDNAGTVVSGWMQSSGHRANILNPAYTEIGVGVAIDSGGRAHYTQVFARPR